MKFIDDICERIVCPPKLRYSPYDLGPVCTSFGKRHDFHAINTNGLKVAGSFYDNKKGIYNKICVIYLHSMNGSRLESLVYVQEMLKIGVTFCNFDFSGCGNSEGNTISFGANEKNDVYAIVELLRQKFNVNKVILWGRSMGSACAVKYCQMIENSRRHHLPQVKVLGIILDSCFKSFSQLAVQIGHKHSQYPQFLIKAGYFVIKGTLQQKGKFKVDDLQLQRFISHLKVPALFLTSREDVTVNSDHSKSLYDQYSHLHKKLVFINGSHNQSRDSSYLSQVKEFVSELLIDDKNRHDLQYFSQMRVNKFQKIMEQRRNFVLEGDEVHAQFDGCYCSLLSAEPNYVRMREEERAIRKNNPDKFLEKEKTRFNKLAFSNEKKVKSTKNVKNHIYH